jgi:hypothetical protein
MYKETIRTREMLIKVLDALDMLDKEYTVKKTIERVDTPRSGLPSFDKITWVVEEVNG